TFSQGLRRRTFFIGGPLLKKNDLSMSRHIIRADRQSARNPINATDSKCDFVGRAFHPKQSCYPAVFSVILPACGEPTSQYVFFFLWSFSLHAPGARRSHRPLFQPTADSFSTSILTHGNQKTSLHCRRFLSTYRLKTGQDFPRAVWKSGANRKTSW